MNSIFQNKKVLIGLAIAFGIAVLGTAGFFLWKLLISQRTASLSRGYVVTPSVAEKEVSAEITAETGGKLAFEGGEVDFPKKSFLVSETVKGKKITALANLKNEWQFVSGIELGPDKTELSNLALLKFNLPAGTDTKKLIGFSYSANGERFQFAPVKIEGNTAIVPVGSFSGHGILNLSDPKVYPETVSEAESEALRDLALGRENDTYRQLLGAGEGNAEAKSQVAYEILLDWYNKDIKKKLLAALKDETKINDAVFTLMRWHAMCDFYGVSDRLEGEYETALDITARAIKYGLEKSTEKCYSEKDPTRVGRMFDLAGLAQLIDADNRNTLSTSDIMERAQKCARFKFTIKSKFSTNYGTGVSYDISSGSADLVLDRDFKFKGDGKITVTEYFDGQRVCASNGKEEYLFKMKDLKLEVGKGKSKTIVPINVYGETLVPYDCSFDVGETHVTVNDGGGAWFFPVLHKDELNLAEETFYIKNWQIIGSKEVFARKEYKRTVTPNLPELAGLPVPPTTEDTTMELIHLPIK